MEKKFKCQSCGHEFVADTNQYVTCPKCDSDNIALVKTTSPVLKIVLLVVAALAIIGGVVAAGTAFLNREPDVTTGGDEPIIEEQDSVVTEEKIIEKIDQNMPEQLELESVGEPAYDEKTGTYSVSVKANVEHASNPSTFSICYTISELGSNKAIATNETGNFSGLRPIIKSNVNPDCSYQVTARAIKDNVCVDTIPAIIPGFVVQASNIEKISVAEAEALINKKKTVEITNSGHFGPDVNVYCNGGNESDEIPNDLNKFILFLKSNSSVYRGVRVNKLDYNNKNLVTAVYLTLIPNEE